MVSDSQIIITTNSPVDALFMLFIHNICLIIMIASKESKQLRNLLACDKMTLI